MTVQNHMLDRESSRARRAIFKLAVIVLLSMAGLSGVIGLAQPSLVVARSAESAGSIASAAGINASVAVTYQIYLPLVTLSSRNSTFGAQLYGSLTAPNGFTRAVELGVGWVRIPIYWAQIEPVNTTPDQYNWAATDASVQAAQNAGIKVIFTLDQNPAWAAAEPIGPVTNTADLQEFIGAAVARYPSVLYWEIYNEPDLVPGLGATRGGFGNHGDVYAALLSSLYPVIKSANPAAQLVMGGLAMDYFVSQGGPFDQNFLPNVLANCTGTCFDVANFHYYPPFRGAWNDYGPDIIGKATFVRLTMATYGFTRPVIATETSWPSALNWGSPELAARYVAKSYARSLAADLKATIWYAMLDADSSNPGLLDSTTTPGVLTPRPAYAAYQTLSALLSGASYQGVAPAIDPIEGYQFTASGRRLDVYWYDCPYMRQPLSDGPHDCTNTGTLNVQASRIGVIDKFGAKVIKNDGDDGVVDGKVTLTVGSSPIYVDYAP
jgi:hypothetical protein